MFFIRILALIAFCSTVLFGESALASIPRFDDVMPLSQVRPGMKGYGLTVFRGTKIERFEVTVVGVVKKGSLIVPGHDMILIRLSGGPFTHRGAYMIRGMSGSPIYVNGKIIGAYSQAEPATKEPLGGVTPIEDMLEAWDPKLSDTPVAVLPDNQIHTVKLPEPIRLGNRKIEKVVYNVPHNSGMRSHGSTVVLHPCTTVATFSSLSRWAYEKLKKALEPYNVEVMATRMGGGQKKDFAGSPLVPGAAFSMMLITGDSTVGATGTVSYRRGNRILGFGHPFMGIGPIGAPLCSAYVYDIYPLLAGSYKISSPGPVVGSSSQDRNFAISGVIGKMPKTIPVVVEVKDLSTGRERVFRSQAVSHPNLSAPLVSAAVASSIAEIRNIPGATMARVTTTVEAEEVGTITRSNLVFDSRAIDGAATADLDDILSILTSNPFYPVGIKSAHVKVEMESANRTAQIERIFLKEGRFEPGKPAELGVVIKPYRQPSVTRTVKIMIPPNTPNGRYVLQVRGGAVPPPISIGGFIIRQRASQDQEQAPPVNIRQMVERYVEREKNNEFIARLILPTTAVNVEGERLSGLPPSLDAVIRSTKSSGVRMERDEVRVVESTDWVVSGQQLLAINVQRKDMQETPSGNVVRPTSPNPPSVPVGGGNPSTSEGGYDANVAPMDSSVLGPEEADISSSPTVVDVDTKQEKSPLPAPVPTPRTIPAPRTGGGAGHPGQKGETRLTETAKGTPFAPATSSAASSSAQESAETPVGRAPRVWKQTSKDDFDKGTCNGVCSTSQGDLRLTRTLRRLCASGDSFLWTLLPDGQGGLFAGTGTQGRILHFDSSGNQRIIAKLPEVSVHCLLRAPDGTLWAGTGPNGRIYRVSLDGKHTVPLQTADKYALAIARDSKGNIFIGTGGGGNIYRIAPDGSSRLFFATSENHVLCLAVDKADNLYAGTANSGLVLKINSKGKATVLFDAQEESIAALCVNDKGMVYAATAPRGVLYRITPDGSAVIVYDKTPTALTALCVAPDGTIYVTGGNTVLAVLPDDTVVPLGSNSDVDYLSLAVDPSGTLYAGTANVAEVYAAAPPEGKQEGVYESVVHDAKQTAKWGAIRWSATTPPGTHILVQTRTGDVAEPDSTWSPWMTPQPEPDGGVMTNPPGRYVQYRVVFSSDSPTASPSLHAISLTYLTKNQPPKVVFQSPEIGERWGGRKTIKWQASDPDKDTLHFTLYYSADGGTNWQPLPTAVGERSTSSVPVPPVAGSTAGRVGLRSVEEVTAELDKHPDLPPTLREAILARTRTLLAQTTTGASGSGPTSAGATPLTETSHSFDTKALPDGTYRLKVVATDAPSNPTDARTAEAISDPFVICNAKPAVILYKSAIKVNSDGSVSLEGTAAQLLIAVSAVQYRIDGGKWVAAVPTDGIFDTQIENFTITTIPLTRGKHVIEVKAFNEASGTAVETVEVEVK